MGGIGNTPPDDELTPRRLGPLLGQPSDPRSFQATVIASNMVIKSDMERAHEETEKNKEDISNLVGAQQFTQAALEKLSEKIDALHGTLKQVNERLDLIPIINGTLMQIQMNQRQTGQNAQVVPPVPFAPNRSVETRWLSPCTLCSGKGIDGEGGVCVSCKGYKCAEQHLSGTLTLDSLSLIGTVIFEPPLGSNDFQVNVSVPAHITNKTSTGFQVVLDTNPPSLPYTVNWWVTLP